MKTKARLSEQHLLEWFYENRRSLPWREAREPYRVWVSEIMLQQTRIDTVIGYFKRFMKAFPTVEALAEAEQSEVLKSWEGLGYYSRARNLQAAAKRVVEKGGFPRTAEEWKQLPGVGEYTAAAIASLCYEEAVPVVDGNVVRVCTRLLALDEYHAKDVRLRPLLAEWLLPSIRRAKSAGDFNEAIMELGETLCTVKGPRCGDCPLAKECRAKKLGKAEAFPKKAPTKEVPTRRFVAFLVEREVDGRLLLVKRPETGLLGGLWELPMTEQAREPSEKTAKKEWEILRQRFAGVLPETMQETEWKRLPKVVHVFSHFRQELYMWRIVVKTAGEMACEEQTAWDEAVEWSRPEEKALATASKKVIRSAVQVEK